jgi:transcription initiation factor IIE alpha subunit
MTAKLVNAYQCQMCYHPAMIERIRVHRGACPMCGEDMQLEEVETHNPELSRDKLVQIKQEVEAQPDAWPTNGESYRRCMQTILALCNGVE